MIKKILLFSSIFLFGNQFVNAQGPECGSATALTTMNICGGTQTVFGSTAGETPVTESFCSAVPGTNGAKWYSFVGDGAVWNVSTISPATDFNTQLIIYDGSCGALNCVASNDDFLGFESQVTFPTTMGVTYHIAVTGVSAVLSGEGIYEMTISSIEVIEPVADVTTLPDLTDVCSVSTPIAPTATDNCAGSITGTTTITFPITTPGTTQIYWLYNDGNGNVTIQTQNIIITGGATTNLMTQNECTTSFTWTAGNSLTYTNDTTVYYVDPMPNANGCDSVLILDLVFSTTYVDTTVIACKEFTWFGTTYTTSGTHTQTLVNAVGCDSIITLNLTVNQSSLLEQTVTTTNPILCATNTGTTVITAGSETNANYYLRNDLNNSIIDGPIPGTGSGLTFNTGILSNTMTYNVYAENTVINNVLNFDGVDDKVVLPNETDYDFTTDMTVEFWIKASSFDQWDGFVTKGDDSWRVHAHASGTVNFGLNGTGTGAGANSTTPIDDDTWHHVAATYGSNTAKIYIDGIMENSTVGTNPIDNSSYAVAIGENLQQTGRPLNGSMDEVRIWNVARTSAQINATMSIELVGNEAGLVSYYNFNQGVAGGNNVGLDSLIDLTSNANNGTLTNFALSGTTSNWYEKESTCPREMTQTASVTVLPELTGTHTETVCFGESIVVNGTTYDANNLTGTEVYTNIGANNCDSTVTVNLTIENQIDTTTTTASTTTTSNHTSATATYQWIDCGNNQPISGETNSTYTAAVNGDYAVIITEGNCSDTSACVAIASVGIDELSSLGMSIYPNPNNGEFTIATTLKNATVSIYSLDGKLILSNIKITQSNPAINLENFEDGVYFVTIKNETNQKTVRVVIKK